jgi:hypothetical protein
VTACEAYDALLAERDRLAARVAELEEHTLKLATWGRENGDKRAAAERAAICADLRDVTVHPEMVWAEELADRYESGAHLPCSTCSSVAPNPDCGNCCPDCARSDAGGSDCDRHDGAHLKPAAGEG